MKRPLRGSINLILVLLLGLAVSAQGGRGTIVGQIHLRDGAPAEGVRVGAMLAGESGASTLFGIAQTDADGRFRIEDLPAGRYHVVAGPVGQPVYHPGVDGADAATVVTVSGAVVRGLDFTVDLARMIAAPPPRPATFQTGTQQCPPASASAPTLPLAADDFVQLERAVSGFGVDASYRVRIMADGRVIWTGISRTRVDRASAAIDAGKARDLIERYRSSAFWSLCDRYRRSISEGVILVTTVRTGGQEKSVSDYANAAPGWLQRFEDEIDRLADTHRWVHGDPKSEALSASNLSSDAEHQTKPGWTPLMEAVSRSGSRSAGRGTMSSKDDPNAQDASGWTPLMYAALGADPIVIETLLDAGADPHIRSGLGQTAVMAHVAIANTLSGLDPIPSLKLLLAAGADINAVDSKGQTALMMTIPQAFVENENTTSFLKRVNLAAFLRDNGARADIRDASGRTVLDLLDAEAKRFANPPPKSQYEKLRIIFEQSAATGPSVRLPVQLRGVVRPRETDLRSLTLQRAGAGTLRFSAPVGSDGTVDFSTVPPGVYSVLLSPKPAIPVSTPPVIVPNSGATDVEIAVPAIRQIRVTANAQGRMPPVFWLLLVGSLGAFPPASPVAPRAIPRQAPANITAALAAGARPHLIQVGGPVSRNVLMEVNALLPVIFPSAVELPALPEGGYGLTLPEGEYIVMPLILKPDAVEAGTELLRVSGPGQEFHFTLSPKVR